MAEPGLCFHQARNECGHQELHSALPLPVNHRTTQHIQVL